MDEGTHEMHAEEVRRTVRALTDFVEAVRRPALHAEDGLEVQVAFIRKANEILARFPAELLATRDEKASGVLYALNPETTRWAAARIDEAERPLWQALQIEPEVAGRWVAAGLGVEAAARWKNARPFYFRGEGIDPTAVAEWERVAVPPETAMQWMERDVSPDRAVQWTSLGGRLGDGLNWLGRFPDEAVEDLHTVSQSALGLPDVAKYVERGVPICDAPGFAAKGYTPFAAAKLTQQGTSATAAENRTGDEPIPGRAWTKIKNAAEGNGWTVSSITEVVTNPRRATKQTRVVFTHPDPNRREVRAFFEANRFRSGTRRSRSYWEERTTTIGTLISDFLA